MNQFANDYIKSINKTRTLINKVDEQLNQTRNNREYDKLMNQKVDLMKSMMAQAKCLASSLEHSINIEAEIGGHFGNVLANF